MHPLTDGRNRGLHLLRALASVAVGALLYRAVEKPIMAWRDRAVPSLFAPPAAPAVRAAPA